MKTEILVEFIAIGYYSQTLLNKIVNFYTHAHGCT